MVENNVARPSNKAEINSKSVVAPHLWLILGDKLGDNAQVELIAESLGWPFELKQLYFKERYVLGKPWFRPTLHHIDKTRSDALEPPWPDLIITIGRRPTMAAIWIRKQSAGHTKIVLINRPKRYFNQFSLVITSAQFRVPNRPNVLRLELPLMRVNQAVLVTAAKQWRGRFANLPRPLIALLVGGPTKPFIFNAEVANQLMQIAADIASKAGGTLYVTTSRRTPRNVVEMIEAQLPSNGVLYRWDATGKNNPYHGLLALADHFIVTGDSISMLVEVSRIDKPLAIFPLPYRQDFVSIFRQKLGELLHPRVETENEGGVLESLGDFLYRLGILRYSRDLTAIHRLLIKRGLAAQLGVPFTRSGIMAPDELPCVVERIRLLMDYPH